MNGTWKYIVRIGDALSQLVNVVFLLSENPNESVSGRAYRMRAVFAWAVCMRVLNAVFFWQDNHSRLSYHADVERAKSVLASVEE